jgi:hypothetical protein
VSTIKHAAYAETATSALTTDLNSLANSGYSALSSAVTNSSGLHLFADLEIYLASATFVAGGYVAVYVIPTVDGTNYAYSTVPASTFMVAAVPVASGTGARYVTATNVPLPPADFKWQVGNFTGVALASSGNTLKYRRHSIDVN